MKRNHATSEYSAEGLSCLADSEISLGDLDDWVDVMAEDGQARRRFARYRVIGAHLANEEAVRVDASEVADRVSAALREEPVVLSPRPARSKRALPLQRLALGGALAAGVALLAVGVAPRIAGLNEPATSLDTPSFAFAPRLSAPSADITPVALGPAAGYEPRGMDHPGQRWKVLPAETQRKISRYLLEHNELAGQIAAQRPSAHLSYISTHEAQP